MPDLEKVKQALEHAMRVTVGERVRRQLEEAIEELEPVEQRPRQQENW
jgi:Arc/MetJ family transcription regulator